MREKINKDMKFKEVMDKYPETSEVFFSIGLGCAMCHGAAYESIEQGCKMHGMKDEDIDKLIKKLNEKINK